MAVNVAAAFAGLGRVDKTYCARRATHLAKACLNCKTETAMSGILRDVVGALRIENVSKLATAWV